MRVLAIAAAAAASISADEFSQFGSSAAGRNDGGVTPAIPRGADGGFGRPFRRTALFQSSPPAGSTAAPAAAKALATPNLMPPNVALPAATPTPSATVLAPPAPPPSAPLLQGLPPIQPLASPDGALLNATPFAVGNACAPGGCAPTGCMTMPSGPCGACCGDDAAAMLPRFFLEVGTTFLRRDGIREQGLAARRNAGGVQFLTAKDLEADSWNGGAQIVFGGALEPGLQWEGSFLGIQEWNRANNFTGGLLEASVSGLPIAADNARANNLTALALGTQDIGYTTQFLTGDLGAKLAWTLCPRQYFTFGVRFADIRERASFVETGLVGNPAAGVAAATAGDVQVRVRNSMIGPQLGYHARLGSPWKRLAGDFSIKGALVFDFARTRINSNLASSPLGPRAFRTGATETESAGLFHFQGGGVFRVKENFALRGGYQAIAVLGYASALSQTVPQAYATDRTIRVNTGEKTVYHGPYAALEWTWGGHR